jgi:hypothetical protein
VLVVLITRAQITSMSARSWRISNCSLEKGKSGGMSTLRTVASAFAWTILHRIS